MLSWNIFHSGIFTRDSAQTKHSSKWEINTNLCSFGKGDEESMKHVMLYCRVSKQILSEIEKGIIDLGIKGYKLSDSKTNTGELEKALCINSIVYSHKEGYLQLYE